MRRSKPVPKPRNLLRTQYQTTWVRLDYGESRLVKCLQFDSATCSTSLAANRLETSLFDGSIDLVHMYAHRRLAEIYHHTEILGNMEGR